MLKLIAQRWDRIGQVSSVEQSPSCFHSILHISTHETKHWLPEMLRLKLWRINSNGIAGCRVDYASRSEIPVTMFPLEMTVPAPSEMVLNPFVHRKSNSVKITNEICISDRSRQFELN